MLDIEYSFPWNKVVLLILIGIFFAMLIIGVSSAIFGIIKLIGV